MTRVCTELDIHPLYLAENLKLSYPDAFVCRMHRCVFATQGEALEHVERMNSGLERRHVKPVEDQ